MTAFSTCTLLYRLLEPGANLGFVDVVLVYISPFWFFTLGGEWGVRLVALAKWNASCQFALFLFVVQIPTLLTHRMSYVDIGWPAGLLLIAVNAFIFGGGKGMRPMLVCGALLLHGGRMFVGSLFMFYPYIFKEDLSRYQYAQTRFIEHTGAPSWWWIKQQHDTLGQCMANCVCLAVPIMLAATNQRESMHWLEISGLLGWMASSAFENAADGVKIIFEGKAKENGDISTAVLGHPPYNTGLLTIWAWCRHPNYFGEWCCWVSFCVMALPSALELAVTQESLIARIGTFVMLYCVIRLFYDCLVHWTGAAPAESRSVQRRPTFKEYQASTNVFFPFGLPLIDHHRTPGWPLCMGKKD